MKKTLTLLSLLFFIQSLSAQINDRNTIDVMGSSKMTIAPDAYKAQVLIQEEEQKINYQTIGKTSIDSIKILFFRSLKKYNVDEKDVKLIGMSSQAVGQYPYFLSNQAYEFPVSTKQRGQDLVSELRFAGLKGVVIKSQYSNASHTIQDALYEDALKDANRVALLLAKKVNKTLGEVKSIQLQDRQIPGVGREVEIYSVYNSYNLARFEMDYKDATATCNLRVSYELK